MAKDPFDTLGLPPRFDIDTNALQKALLARSAALHPDIAAGDPEAAASVARVNEAHATLADPERRAEALLIRLGGPSREENRDLPEGFLPEIMEARESMEADRSDPDAMARWKSWALERRDRHIANVRERFAEVKEAPDSEILAAIRVELNAWRYIERMLEQIEPEYDPFADERSG